LTGGRIVWLRAGRGRRHPAAEAAAASEGDAQLAGNPIRPPLAAALLLVALAACAVPPAPVDPAPPRAAHVAAPASLIVAIVGNGSLVGPQSAPAGRPPLLVDLWLEAAGVARSSPDLAFDMTGNSSAVAMVCSLEPERQRAALRQVLQRQSPDDPLHEATRYAVVNFDRLQHATFALLTRRLSPDEVQACRGNGVRLREVLLGSVACGEVTCPAVLVVSEGRLAGQPLAQRLLAGLIGPGGLAFDAGRLRTLGLQEVAQDDVREASRALLHN
jgi:hypothetical protein